MPNPTSGFALFFHENEVSDSGMTVEDAIRFVVSGGMVVHQAFLREKEKVDPIPKTL
jgi:uncharacterized membrane protein